MSKKKQLNKLLVERDERIIDLERALETELVKRLELGAQINIINRDLMLEKQAHNKTTLYLHNALEQYNRLKDED